MYLAVWTHTLFVEIADDAILHFARTETILVCNEWFNNGAYKFLEFSLYNSYEASLYYIINVSHVTRKHVFGVCDQVRLKSACAATEVS